MNEQRQNIPAKPEKSTLSPCPHCGGTPWFTGDANEWKDDHRYVELSLQCCATMTEGLGWREANKLTVEQRTATIQQALIAAWNKRHNEQPVVPVPTSFEDWWFKESTLDALEKNLTVEQECRLAWDAAIAAAIHPGCVVVKDEPVAWVEVVNTYEGPYNFHGKELLPVGKHDLYAKVSAARPGGKHE